MIAVEVGFPTHLGWGPHRQNSGKLSALEIDERYPEVMGAESGCALRGPNRITVVPREHGVLPVEPVRGGVHRPGNATFADIQERVVQEVDAMAIRPHHDPVSL